MENCDRPAFLRLNWAIALYLVMAEIIAYAAELLPQMMKKQVKVKPNSKKQQLVTESDGRRIKLIEIQTREA